LVTAALRRAAEEAVDPRATLDRFFAALARLDSVTLKSCYSDDARFEDELFSLHGSHAVGGMWRMLCENVRHRGRMVWQLDVQDISTQGGLGSARWEAQYLYQDRPVHNIVSSDFSFDGLGLIRRHRDHFDFWSWSRQALGWRGNLAGWTPYMRKRTRREAAARLRRFVSVL
jgi:hypothetical protein